MIVALKMPETTADAITSKHQVLYGEVMRGVDTGVGCGEGRRALETVVWGRTSQTDPQIERFRLKFSV